ncbi:zinc ribbon domain-containing protein [Aeoliella sp. ICT_H6.2]|uniref:Zinc ribbon domain-containing protein n=1 Tax=Aeoliella straminimaris TaxID=2954799 RepID=A0A9X2JE21_9BACT|nr:zinc ribbon domain-containing protein [Aeoliella straminimaris]MCO6042520.1 zinc ribbon domain-containing protein [Aeoliella straminimaris]
MAATRTKSSSKVWQWLQKVWHRHRHESSHCSECDQPIRYFDQVCPHCGQGSPARISPWVAVYLFVGVAMIWIIYSAFHMLLH